MKSSRLLRFTDRYLGTALCQLISIPAVIGLSGKVDSRKPRKILVIELFEMGAASMISPSLSYLRKSEPSLELYCLTTEGMRETWAALGQIPPENVFTIKDKGIIGFGLSALRQVWELRRIRLDLVIDYELFFRASGI